MIEVLSIFDDKQVKMMKDDFIKDFNAMCNYEKRWAWEHGVPRVMDTTRHNEVMLLVAKCGNAYQVEALKRLVLRDFVIPTWDDVERNANTDMTKDLKAGSI
jgi:hypothetical protein